MSLSLESELHQFEMAFFRKWKSHYKHKQLKSTDDDTLENETWRLQSTIPSTSDIQPQNLNWDNDSHTVSVSYLVKYLGCTPIETTCSEKIVAPAIKAVRSLKQKPILVSVNIFPHKLEVVDSRTLEILEQFSIYDVSYCTAQKEIFAFVGAAKDLLRPDQEKKSSCHVFQCPKRKVAHEITMALAGSFGHAYQHWRDQVVQQQRNETLDLLNEGNVSGDDNTSTSSSENVSKVEQTNWIQFDEEVKF